jgi:hypothetical protein
MLLVFDLCYSLGYDQIILQHSYKSKEKYYYGCKIRK